MKQKKFILPILATTVLTVAPIATMATTSCSNYKPLESYTWEEIKEISKGGEAYKTFRLGDTKKVQLKHQDINNNGKIDKNEVYQTVRIIGFDHDWTTNNKTIGITFEFVDQISDYVGRSIATYYNEWGTKPAPKEDSEDNFVAALNYSNSWLRSALVGDKTSGAGEETVHWYGDYGPEGEDNVNKHFIFPGEMCYNTSVKNMLPDDLKQVITPAAKLYNYVEKDPQQNALKLSTSYVVDELFVLTPREVGFAAPEQEPFSPTYEYYKGHTLETDSIRSKHQIRRNLGHDNLYSVEDGNYLESVSAAGCNKNGDVCWLRTPNIETGWARAYAINNETGTVCALGGHLIACCVAPAFCV